jgi:hypothetical protein
MIPGDRRHSEKIAKGILRGVLVDLFRAWVVAALASTVSASLTISPDNCVPLSAHELPVKRFLGRRHV